MRDRLTPEQLREFFRLVAVWLHCRHGGMDSSDPDPAWRLLGELDYGAEIELLMIEVQSQQLPEGALQHDARRQPQ